MLTLEQFLEEVSSIPWFSRLGQDNDEGLPRITSFEDWPGPSSPPTEALHLHQQELRDTLFGLAPSDQVELEAQWTAIESTVLSLASAALGHPLDGDSWDGPTMAAWHAAWTAGLVFLSQRLGQAPTGELKNQWRWFCDGHWPCAYSSMDVFGNPVGLVVY